MPVILFTVNTLETYGWSADLKTNFEEASDLGFIPARVVADFGTSLKLATPEIITAELSGKLAHHSSKLLVPKIGDWVKVRVHANGDAVVDATFARRNEIARRAPGKRTAKQIIATNVDIAFVILSLDNDFSIERLRRFLHQLSVSNVNVVIVLNKSDKTSELQTYIDQLESFTLPIVTMSALHDNSNEKLLSHINPGETAILLGSSGVGKSTITNLLLGNISQKTQKTRASDDTGKHTTVHRELFVLPNGGLLIDTPGIRELQLWGDESDLKDTFEDVIQLSAQCKFRSCRHGSEQGCRVQEALSRGELARNRYNAYLQMKQELITLKDKHIAHIKREKRRRRPLHSDFET